MGKTPSRILCIGALHWDRQLRCLHEESSGESNPVVTTHCPGGVALNVATTLIQLGCNVGLSSRVGKDKDGDSILDHLATTKIDPVAIESDDTIGTASYTAVLDVDGNLIIGLADMSIYDRLDDRYWSEHTAVLAGWNAWCIDTNLPESGLRYLCSQKNKPRLYALATSPAKITRLRTMIEELDTLIVNIAEASALTGTLQVGLDGAQEAARLLFESGIHRTLVTAGPAGAAWADYTGTGVIPGVSQPGHTKSVSGAGDTLSGVVIAALEQGQSTEVALQFGVQAGALAVESGNTSTRQSWELIQERLDSING